MEHAERAAYVVSGAVEADTRWLGAGQMAVFQRPCREVLQARTPSVLMLLGGARRARFIEWTLFPPPKSAFAQAKATGKAGG